MDWWVKVHLGFILNYKQTHEWAYWAHALWLHAPTFPMTCYSRSVFSFSHMLTLCPKTWFIYYQSFTQYVSPRLSLPPASSSLPPAPSLFCSSYSWAPRGQTQGLTLLNSGPHYRLDYATLWGDGQAERCRRRVEMVAMWPPGHWGHTEADGGSEGEDVRMFSIFKSFLFLWVKCTCVSPFDIRCACSCTATVH